MLKDNVVALNIRQRHLGHSIQSQRAVKHCWESKFLNSEYMAVFIIETIPLTIKFPFQTNAYLVSVRIGRMVWQLLLIMLMRN